MGVSGRSAFASRCHQLGCTCRHIWSEHDEDAASCWDSDLGVCMQHIFILGGRSLACEASTVKAQAGWHSLLTHDLATLMSASATGARMCRPFCCLRVQLPSWECFRLPALPAPNKLSGNASRSDSKHNTGTAAGLSHLLRDSALLPGPGARDCLLPACIPGLQAQQHAEHADVWL